MHSFPNLVQKVVRILEFEYILEKIFEFEYIYIYIYIYIYSKYIYIYIYIQNIYIYIYNSTELSLDWTSREFQNQTILFLRKIKSSI